MQDVSLGTCFFLLFLDSLLACCASACKPPAAHAPLPLPRNGCIDRCFLQLMYLLSRPENPACGAPTSCPV